MSDSELISSVPELLDLIPNGCRLAYICVHEGPMPPPSVRIIDRYALTGECSIAVEASKISAVRTAMTDWPAGDVCWLVCTRHEVKGVATRLDRLVELIEGYRFAILLDHDRAEAESVTWALRQALDLPRKGSSTGDSGQARSETPITPPEFCVRAPDEDVDDVRRYILDPDYP